MAALFAQPAVAEVSQPGDIAMFRNGAVSQFDAATNQFDLAGPRPAAAVYAPSATPQPLASFDDDMRINLVPPQSEERDAAGSSLPKDPDLLQPKYQWRNMAKLEIAFQILNAVDTAETAYCLHKDICQEANPLLSKNPSTGRLIATKAVVGVVHYAITRLLFKSDPEATRYWLIGSLIVQGGVVGWNAKTCF